MHMAVKTASIAVGALAFITTFSACSSSQEAVSSSTTASAAADIDRQAGVLGTRVCIKNESSTVAKVVFTLRDTARGEGTVVSGTEACGEGTFAMTDVRATITFASPLPEVFVIGANNWWESPFVELWITNRMCVSVISKEGDKGVWDDGVMRYTVQRLADGQWKEFTVTLSDSEQPSASGLPERCSVLG